MEKKCEILAPVGSKEMLTAAVRSGADAVYLGAESFNARRNAENFSDRELKNAIDYCHINGVFVYLTLNIIISDSEMCQALTLVKKAYEYGVDALIVADLGLARLIHKNYPDLPIHGSTQLSIISPSAIPQLKEWGFTRIVVAREISKTELIEFCKEAEKYNIEVEAFVHGALCMCVSGKCLLSAFLGGRSGNRGLCAGPCRLPFKVKNGTGYDLSLKDMSLCKYLNEMKETGVKSFKIEGRMKRPEYVAAAVTVCKGYLNKQEDKKLEKMLADVFSRSGFTDGYYTEKTGREMFGIRTKENVLNATDSYPELHKLYRNECQRVALIGTVEIEKDKEIRFTVSDNKNTVTVLGEMPEVAQKKEISKEDVCISLSKTGATPYYFEKLGVNAEKNLFVRASSLNALRRQALEKLNEKRIISRKSKDFEIETQSDIKHTFKGFAVRVKNPGQIPENLKDVSFVVLPVEAETENIDIEGEKIIAELPGMYKNKNYILNRLKLFKSMGVKYAAWTNIAQLPLIKEADLVPIASFGLNIYNSYTAFVFEKAGAKGITVSCEATVNAINNMKTKLPKSYIAYGKIPLMIFRNCPNKNGDGCEKCDKKAEITDRMGVSFNISCREGYSELFNSVPIYLADRQDEFLCEYPVLYFTDEDKRECEKILQKFREKASCENSYTRGLYYKGVL